MTTYTSMASATLVDAIGALNPGDQFRILFVSSAATPATSNDIDYYNNFANNAGINGLVTMGLGLTWQAVASTQTVNALTNTGTSPSADPVSIFNTNGDLLARSYADLWDGRLSVPVGYTEDGVATNHLVWTGTKWNGLRTGALGTDYPQLGCSSLRDFHWIECGSITGDPNTWPYSLYAISEQATAPPVPLPPAGVLFTAALFGLLGTKRLIRKQ